MEKNNLNSIPPGREQRPASTEATTNANFTGTPAPATPKNQSPPPPVESTQQATKPGEDPEEREKKSYQKEFQDIAKITFASFADILLFTALLFFIVLITMITGLTKLGSFFAEKSLMEYTHSADQEQSFALNITLFIFTVIVSTLLFIFPQIVETMRHYREARLELDRKYESKQSPTLNDAKSFLLVGTRHIYFCATLVLLVVILSVVIFQLP